jgi:predicted CXXCH cytochrome family protein
MAARARVAAPWLALAAVAGVALIVLLAEARAVSDDLATPRDLHRVGFVGSAACTRCHAAHAASFERTFHRTMTREADREAVRAPFEGETLAYGGFVARMLREPDRDGRLRFVVELSQGDEVLDRVEVVRTVGSRRHQQYLGREDDRWARLPVAWNVEEGRWFHMNEAFLTPDPEGLDEGAASRADYARHVVQWNDNCVFCHNVGARPGLDPASGRFATEVAELGVACEACHGPGAEHVRANESPVRRYALHRGGLGERRADPTIVDPSALPPDRAADVCGRCHGQRITDDVGRFLRDGDPFVPGEDLALYSAPLFEDTTLRGEEGAFATRFWDDGTARLTAYEYQGLTQSRCASEGGLTCVDCHAMHEGDPRGQLRPSAAGDAMCTRCHAELSAAPARLAHVRPPSGVAPLEGPAHARVACIDCHMPRVVYGIRAIHRSHRIDSPAPPRPGPAEARQRPDACSLCHLGGELARGAGGTSPPEHAPLELLFAGDPVQRAVIAAALGRGDAASPGARERTALLLEAMRDDEYPAVRAIAWAGARSLSSDPPEVSAFTATEGAPARRAATDAIARALGIVPAPPGGRASLRARASTRAIEIGE